MLYKALSGDTEVHEDIATVFMNYLEEKGTTVSKLMEASKVNGLEYHFSNWM